MLDCFAVCLFRVRFVLLRVELLCLCSVCLFACLFVYCLFVSFNQSVVDSVMCSFSMYWQFCMFLCVCVVDRVALRNVYNNNNHNNNDNNVCYSSLVDVLSRLDD